MLMRGDWGEILININFQDSSKNSYRIPCYKLVGIWNLINRRAEKRIIVIISSSYPIYRYRSHYRLCLFCSIVILSSAQLLVMKMIWFFYSYVGVTCILFIGNVESNDNRKEPLRCSLLVACASLCLLYLVSCFSFLVPGSWFLVAFRALNNTDRAPRNFMPAFFFF